MLFLNQYTLILDSVLLHIVKIFLFFQPLFLKAQQIKLFFFRLFVNTLLEKKEFFFTILFLDKLLYFFQSSTFTICLFFRDYFLIYFFYLFIFFRLYWKKRLSKNYLILKSAIYSLRFVFFHFKNIRFLRLFFKKVSAIISNFDLNFFKYKINKKRLRLFALGRSPFVHKKTFEKYVRRLYSISFNFFSFYFLQHFLMFFTKKFPTLHFGFTKSIIFVKKQRLFCL